MHFIYEPDLCKIKYIYLYLFVTFNDILSVVNFIRQSLTLFDYKCANYCNLLVNNVNNHVKRDNLITIKY